LFGCLLELFIQQIFVSSLLGHRKSKIIKYICLNHWCSSQHYVISTTKKPHFHIVHDVLTWVILWRQIPWIVTFVCIQVWIHLHNWGFLVPELFSQSQKTTIRMRNFSCLCLSPWENYVMRTTIGAHNYNILRMLWLTSISPLKHAHKGRPYFASIEFPINAWCFLHTTTSHINAKSIQKINGCLQSLEFFYAMFVGQMKQKFKFICKIRMQ
jgi:hypothetical protein